MTVILSGFTNTNHCVGIHVDVQIITILKDRQILRKYLYPIIHINIYILCRGIYDSI